MCQFVVLSEKLSLSSVTVSTSFVFRQRQLIGRFVGDCVTYTQHAVVFLCCFYVIFTWGLDNRCWWAGQRSFEHLGWGFNDRGRAMSTGGGVFRTGCKDHKQKIVKYFLLCCACVQAQSGVAAEGPGHRVPALQTQPAAAAAT